MKNWNIRKIGQWLLVLFLAFFWVRTIFFKDAYFNFEACCPFGGLQALTTLIANGSLSCNMNALQVVMGILLAISVIFISKLFCGHVCPVGTLSEGFSNLGKRLKLPKYEIGGIGDILLRSLKYILLFITFYFTLQSNDLFCRKFDPFYGTVTLFGEDVTAWMAGLSIALVVGGAIFLRQFWCRYLCPLGAISNAFRYFYVFAVFAGLLIILGQAGVQLDLTIILILVTVLAYVFEIIGIRKNKGLQVLRITRDEHICINCGICDKKCPQGIKVSELKVVNHPDCNMCTECISDCPKEGAIGINGKTKFRWLPTLIVVVLIMIGFIFGTNLTIPTIDIEWGDKEQMERSEMFEMSNLKHVKCYGSSVGFVNKMKTIKGVTGAATYIRDHRVQVMYDTTQISEAQVRRSLFSPKTYDIREPENEATVEIVEVKVNNFFDDLDAVFVANMAKDIDEVYGLKTVYGMPVKIQFFVKENFDIENLKTKIEELDLVYKTAEESFSSKGLYTVASARKSDTTYTGLYLKSLTFPAFKRAFNNRSKYTNEQLASVVVPITSYPKNQQMMHYVINHLGKGNEYIVGLISRYTASGPQAIVFYVKDQTTEKEVVELLAQDKITVQYDNGVKEEFDNPYQYDTSKFE